MWIELVQVGHTACEPTVYHSVYIFVARIRVEERYFFVGCGYNSAVGFKFALMIEPVACREFMHPDVIAAAVVEYHVHHYFKPAVVSCSDKLAPLFVAAETRIYVVVIGCSVAVVGSSRLIVGKDRVDPYCSNPEIVDIVDVVEHTSYVSAMAGTWTRSVGSCDSEAAIDPAVAFWCIMTH